MKTIKLLFLDPSRVSNENLKSVDLIPEIMIIFEQGAHPAYIVDTKIKVRIKPKE